MKEIYSFENYCVTKNGDVYSKKHKIYLKQSTLDTGYKQVSLCRDNKVYSKLVHRLVLESYIPNYENKPQDNHINGIKNDNRLENLEWNTRSENQKHSIKIGIRTTQGEKNSQSKISTDDVLYIFNSSERNYIIAKKYNISPATICDIKKGRSWTHITKMPNLKKIKL